MNERHRTLMVGLAGAVPVAVAQLTISVLTAKVSIAAVVAITAAVSLATYIASFTLVDQLYSAFIWPRFTKRNLSGEWEMQLANLADGSSRTGKVHISHTPSMLRISCVNYRPGTDAAYSTWTSVITDFVDDATLLFLYQVESTADWKPFKRGVMRLQVAPNNPLTMTGDFFDNAPSEDRGPVTFRRVSAP